MQLIGLARLGADAKLRTTPGGTSVANMPLAYNYGRKGDDGKYPTQWVEAALWGALAESLIDYLVKGQQVCVTLDDVHMESYEGRNGTGWKLVGKISTIKLAGGRQEGGQQPEPRQQSAPPPRQQAPAPAPAPESRPADFDNFDDDIPF